MFKLLSFYYIYPMYSVLLLYGFIVLEGFTVKLLLTNMKHADLMCSLIAVNSSRLINSVVE